MYASCIMHGGQLAAHVHQAASRGFPWRKQPPRRHFTEKSKEMMVHAFILYILHARIMHAWQLGIHSCISMACMHIQ